MKLTYHEKFMKKALKAASIAEKNGDVPIGCVIVKNGNVVSVGWNRREQLQDALGHAEIMAIQRACKKLGSWRLDGCDIYVTLEPCPMCAGAIIQARLNRLFIGTMDMKTGAAGSVVDLFHGNKFNHFVEVNLGVLREPCANLLSAFFQKLR